MVETINFTFERSIRAEVVTYRLVVVLGFLHTQQLRGFDESRNDQSITQNRSVKISTIASSLYLPASCSSFRILRLAKKSSELKMAKIVFFDRSDEGQYFLNKDYTRTTR
jgi:hypothetical protein